ncbi:autotransporter outer membrane beta-barrel domain-containing protein [Parasutterella secunda]|uniref:autotransporter outer membrane beta-barrel domain-containing protein n=1 Tax=Parasutterella secunda TaxID=626947 RepID=UPI0025A32980|nr:autotransporter outer membrane beta-barrel domain-containing protein [Parasutterella secunda]MDM8225172.1 autotransporter outer membrane beta-barrel domain-containing protein [Parasutterella secunda]
MFTAPPPKSYFLKTLRFSLIAQCVSIVCSSLALAQPSDLQNEIYNKVNDLISNFPTISELDNFSTEYLEYSGDSLDWFLREEPIKIKNSSITYSGNHAIISASDTKNNQDHHRTQVVFNFNGQTELSFDHLKTIYDGKYNQNTTGGGNPIIFSINKDELGGSSDKTIITGNNLEVLLEEESGKFFFVESGASLELSVKNLYLEANTNVKGDPFFFDIAGTTSLNVENNFIGIVDHSNSNRYVCGIQIKNGGQLTLNAKNTFLINKSNVQNSTGIYVYSSNSSIKSGTPLDTLLLQGFQTGIKLDSGTSLTANANIFGILDSDTGLEIYNAVTNLVTDKLYVESNSKAISNESGKLNLNTEQFYISSGMYAVENNEANTDIKADTSYVIGALSNELGKLAIDFGESAYFRGLTFNYDYGEEYCGEINLNLGKNSLWDISYDKNSLDSWIGMNHLTSLNLTSATVNLAFAENTSNFLKVDKLKGTGSFNLLINTDSHKSTEIHSGTDSEGVFNVSVELAQGSFDQIGNDGILFATDQSGKVQYLPVSSITDAGLTLSTPELVSEDNSGFTEWYISRINNEEGPTPSAMLDGFQNNYLFWRTLTDSTKERFGQLRHGQSAGVWGRVTAGSLSQGDLTNDYQTYRLGADTSIQPGLSLGAMFEIHEGDLDTSNGKGDMQAITAAIYGLYVSPSGYYADAGFRFGVMDYEYKNTALLYDEYDYNSSAVGAWLEVGKEWAFANNYTLTPHLAVNFGRFGTEHFTSDNGLKAKVDSVNSVIFTVGTDVGYKTETFEVSAVADLMTEVAGSQDIRISHNAASLTRSADYSDTWMEFGLSASYRPTDETLLWVNGRRSAFADLDNDWRINAGVRWSFY